MLKTLLKNWYWILFAIIYGLGVYCYSPSKGHDQPKCAEYSDTLSRYDVVTAATDDTPPKRETKQDQKAKVKAALDCSDLKAQWSMADITFWAFGAGLAGMIFVILGWYATRRGLKLAEIASRRELQAYLRFECHANNGNVDGEGLFSSAWFKVWNIGNSPAYNIDIHCVATTEDTKDVVATNIGSIAVKKHAGGYLPHNTDDFTVKHFPIKGVDVSIADSGGIIARGKKKIIAQGFI